MKTSPHSLNFFQRYSVATLAIALICLLAGRAARAGYLVTLDQVGSNVVATGTGAIDLTGLSLIATFNASPQIVANQGIIETGTPPIGSVDRYNVSVSGPANFGSGSDIVPDSGTGGIVGNPFSFGFFFVPHGYVSNTSLSDSSTYKNATFSSLGVTPGTYEWTWGTGANQNFTVQIGPAGVPDTGSSWGLLLFSLAILFGATRFRSLRS